MSGFERMALAAVLVVGTNALGGCVAAPVLLVSEVIGWFDQHMAKGDRLVEAQRQDEPQQTEAPRRPGKRAAAAFGKPSP